MQELVGAYAALKQQLRSVIHDDPIDALLLTVVGGGLAFYHLERDTNPGIQHPWDAVLYMSTCLSVGYDNMFPTTPAGHALATLVQTFGPALASKALDAPASEPDPIVERLDQIIALLSAPRPE